MFVIGMLTVLLYILCHRMSCLQQVPFISGRRLLQPIVYFVVLLSLNKLELEQMHSTLNKQNNTIQKYKFNKRFSLRQETFTKAKQVP